jgi:hypothetical protein
MGCKLNGTSELVCVPGAIAAAERPGHFALAHELFHEQAQERQDLKNGYALRFTADAFESVARFVADERKCCPFVTFEITLASDDGPLWLRMTGPSGTREVLQVELDLAGACACQQESRNG